MAVGDLSMPIMHPVKGVRIGIAKPIFVIKIVVI
jgi:hypothetical protein